MADEEVGIVSDDPSPTSVTLVSKEVESPPDGSVDNQAFTLRDVRISESGGDAGIPANVDSQPLRQDVPLQGVDDGFGGAPNVYRQRPYSSSMISRRTASSTKSRASLSPSITTSEYASKNMFSYRVG